MPLCTTLNAHALSLPTPTPEDQLPRSAVDISIVDSGFNSALPFNPARTPGPHLPPNYEISALSLFELFFDNDTITQFVQATNAYAEMKKQNKQVIQVKNSWGLPPHALESLAKHWSVSAQLNIH